MQNWVNAKEAQARRSGGAAGVMSGAECEALIARAMYIWEVTRRDPRWGDWVDQSDNSLASPEVRNFGRRWGQALAAHWVTDP